MDEESQNTYEEFLKIYNEIDHHLRTEVRDSSRTEHVFLIDQLSRTSSVVARHAQDLRVFAQLRNVLVHNPFMRIANPIALPAKTVVEHYMHIKEALINPPSAMSIAVPASKLYTCTLDSLASEVIIAMEKNTFTHIPVIQSGGMVGVFSENSILAFLARDGEGVVTGDMKISEFKDFIGLSSARSEAYAFISRKAPLSEVYEIFNESIRARRRMGALFLTEHGKESEKVLGLVTAWDLALPDLGSN